MERLEGMLEHMIEQAYPPEPIAAFNTFTTTDGFCFLQTAVIYCPEDFMSAIRNITSEQLTQLHIWKSQVSP